jgi:hypothetical protein
MTAQSHDRCIFDNERWSVPLMSPQFVVTETYGFTPISVSTDCWKGYLQTFSVVQKRLLLQSFHVGLSEDDPDSTRSIAGVAPKPHCGYSSYSNVNLELGFTGWVHLGKDFIRENYVHCGLSGHSDFRKVVALRFVEGDLVEREDISDHPSVGVVNPRQEELMTLAIESVLVQQVREIAYAEKLEAEAGVIVFNSYFEAAAAAKNKAVEIQRSVHVRRSDEAWRIELQDEAGTALNRERRASWLDGESS